eukprot:3030265-Alexandrium_andersonii.AAC.1
MPWAAAAGCSPDTRAGLRSRSVAHGGLSSGIAAIGAPDVGSLGSAFPDCGRFRISCGPGRRSAARAR